MTALDAYLAYITENMHQRVAVGKLIGQHPMTPFEGILTDRVARGESVPGHPSTCTSAPLTCWHGKIWHKGRSGRLGLCQVDGCQCLMFVSQRTCREPRGVPE